MAAESALFAFASSEPRSVTAGRFDRLMQQHGASLLRLAAAYTNSTSDRDDLFQEIALAVWQALPNFRGESSERTFAFRIAHNRAITHLARRRPTAELDEEHGIPDSRQNPEQEVSQEQQRDRLMAAVRRLPAAYRRVIILVLEGLSYAEMANLLGVSESNVGVRVNRAKQMLKEALEAGK